jgi:hypothetical protein
VIVVGPPTLGPPVIVNEPVVAPRAIPTVFDDRETNPSLSCESATFTPGLGAGPFRVIVPVTVSPMPTLFALSVSMMVGCTTLIVPKAGLKPGADAMMFVDPTLSGVIVTVVLSAFGRTIPLGGALAMVGSITERLTTWPLGPAAAPNVTIKVPGVLTRLSGSGDTVIEAGALAVIATVWGVLSWTLSFTINCATYIPATSATKVGDTVLAPIRTALLPAGTVRDHLYVNGA